MRRELRSETGRSAVVSTETRGTLDGLWWADTYYVGMNQTDANDGILKTAIERFPDEASAIAVTVSGTSTDELWQRLAHVGYLEAVSVDAIGSDGPPSAHARAFAVTRTGAREDCLPRLLEVWAAQPTIAPASVTEVVAAMESLSLAYALTLGDLRTNLADPNNRFRPGEGSVALRSKGVEDLERRRLFRRNDAGEWQPTELTTKVAPFVLDGWMMNAKSRSGSRWPGTPPA